MKFVGERRAVAAIVYVFWALFYLVLAVSMMQPALSPAFYAVGAVYMLAFFALVAGYFWARWYAIGVGLYGVLVGAIGLWQMGPEPLIVFIGGTHLLGVIALWGEGMTSPFDGKTEWRAKLHMDENAVRRLGNSVIKAGASLPVVLLYALAPKQPSSAIVVIAAVVCSAFGLRGLIKAKTWGVIALGLAGAIMATVGATHMALVPAISGALLLSAAAPFALPMLRYVRGV